jgi:hypothetical protein
MAKVYEFAAGQEVTMSVRGAGVTSYEDWTVESVEDGVVYLDGSDRRFGLDGKEIDSTDMFGFTFSIAPK